MAKKGKTGYLGLFAFVAMLINAVAWLLQILDEKTSINFGNVTSIMLGISSLMLLLVTLVIAHDFAERQSKTWRIIYWILAISSLLAIFFGVGVNFA